MIFPPMTNKKKIVLTNLISPSFYCTHGYIKENKYTHYWFPGGRGSTKSTFAGVEIVLGISRDAQAGILSNAIVIRRHAITLSGSVVEQIKWAIFKLGQEDFWDIPQAKLEFTYKPTGQKIIFRGADDEDKLKSSKTAIGYFKYIWYEEVVQFENYEKIRSINQSLMRGGQHFAIFYTYNPPKSARNWVNKEVLIPAENKVVIHSNYTTVPKEWLGEPFLVEAEQLKETNYEAYLHEYMGDVVGTGGEVFTNVTLRAIPDITIKTFDRIYDGMDLGFSIDPFVYLQMHYDKKRRRLYIFDEIYEIQLSNINAVTKINERKLSDKHIISDNEPRTLAEMRRLGLKVKPAVKGPNSIAPGIKFLQDLTEIVIDPTRCPNAAREFTEYELGRDRQGDLKPDFPDRDDHTIDATRYALEDIIRSKRSVRSIPRSILGI